MIVHVISTHMVAHCEIVSSLRITSPASPSDKGADGGRLRPNGQGWIPTALSSLFVKPHV